MAPFFAGAALALLDPLARCEAPVGELWRQRLALAAGAAVCALEGRGERESELRDAWAFRGVLDDPGPAGRQYAAWRLLGKTRALRGGDWPQRLPSMFDLVAEELASVLTGQGARLPGRVPPLPFAAGAAEELLNLGPKARGVALWLGDAHLARALGWARPVPLLATHLPRSAVRMRGEDWAMACAVAWGRGAVAAVDLRRDLEHRAAALRAVAPKLRGTGAKATIDWLLREDAIAVPRNDRALRRRMDRLTGFGVVRELTGRPAFRLYGL
ncbi:DUF1403 family protein [Falsirhodobacter algicola]|nr:DUF1403 family protein [Falsirhodobacter algicola]